MKKQELNTKEMSNAAGGSWGGKPSNRLQCPNHEGGHVYVKTGHYENEWFTWIKEGGLFSRGYDINICKYCGRRWDKHV